MRHRRPSTHSTISGISLTPLMDLTFLLLITFIITFPLIEQGIPVNLPRGEAPPIDASDRPVQITLKADGTFWWNEDFIRPENIAERLAQAYAANPEVRLVLRGDRDSNYGRIVEIAAMAKKAGVRSLSLATVEE